MRRVIPSGSKQALGQLEPLPRLPSDLELTLDPRINRGPLTSRVNLGDAVEQGQVIAEGENLKLHAPRTGTVSAVNDALIRISELQETESKAVPCKPPNSPAELPDFAAAMGLVGMGGSMFPYAIKFKAAQDIHTLVINAVECEPGIEIDECLLHTAPDSVAAGIELIVRLFHCKKNPVLAIKKGSRITSAPITSDMNILHMPRTYPAGAEKLITRKLAGRMPPTGVLPVHWGYLVMSVASLWAIGRRLQQGHAAVDRPLTLINPDHSPRNLNVPIGTAARDILAALNIPFDPERQILVAGGQMMGRHVQPDFRVLKGTNALFVHPVPARLRRPEQPCVLCGSCFDACPLHLHPIGMADRIKQRKHSKALAAQLNECFLCGACSAVCPADIPLVEYFQQGKQWLRERS